MKKIFWLKAYKKYPEFDLFYGIEILLMIEIHKIWTKKDIAIFLLFKYILSDFNYLLILVNLQFIE